MTDDKSIVEKGAWDGKSHYKCGDNNYSESFISLQEYKVLLQSWRIE